MPPICSMLWSVQDWQASLSSRASMLCHILLFLQFKVCSHLASAHLGTPIACSRVFAGSMTCYSAAPSRQPACTPVQANARFTFAHESVRTPLASWPPRPCAAMQSPGFTQCGAVSVHVSPMVMLERQAAPRGPGLYAAHAPPIGPCLNQFPAHPPMWACCA